MPTRKKDKKPRFWHQRQRRRGNNCGPTCVAIIANTTQRKACRKMFEQYRPDRYCYSWIPDLERGLKALRIGFLPGKQKARSISHIQKLAIVSVDNEDCLFTERKGTLYLRSSCG
jgi:hypothetical protein